MHERNACRVWLKPYICVIFRRNVGKCCCYQCTEFSGFWPRFAERTSLCVFLPSRYIAIPNSEVPVNILWKKDLSETLTFNFTRTQIRLQHHKHQSWCYLHVVKGNRVCICRWSGLIQQYGFETMDDPCVANTTVHVLSVGEDFVILACVVLTQWQRITDRRTDRQTTDMPTMANTGLCIASYADVL